MENQHDSVVSVDSTLLAPASSTEQFITKKE